MTMTKKMKLIKRKFSKNLISTTMKDFLLPSLKLFTKHIVKNAIIPLSRSLKELILTMMDFWHLTSLKTYFASLLENAHLVPVLQRDGSQSMMLMVMISLLNMSLQ